MKEKRKAKKKIRVDPSNPRRLGFDLVDLGGKDKITFR